jgi:hypothetical protein
VKRLFASIVAAALCFPSIGAWAWWQSVQQVGISAVTLPLDGISTGVKVCYSTRQLLTSYAGNAMQVTRSSDSTTSNIGFSSNVLNTSALSTFCSGTTCKVTTWYDQCGAGDNATSAAAGAPIIYQSGAVTTLNGQPAPLFVSATPTYLTTTITANPVNTLYQNAVVLNTATSAAQGIASGSVSAALEWRVDSTAPQTLHLLKAATATIDTSLTSNPLTASVAAVVEVQYNSSTGAIAFWVNRTTAGTNTNAQTLTAANLYLGYGDGDASWSGEIGEYISYDLAGGIPSGSRTSIENNQQTYWGTP